MATPKPSKTPVAVGSSVTVEDRRPAGVYEEMTLEKAEKRRLDLIFKRDGWQESYP